jgi:hypothetical protein
MQWLVVILSTVFVLSLLVWYGASSERRAFNGGVCPTCKKPLRWFDTDSQGGRGYSCRDCDYTCWVSYPWVDRKYRDSYVW